MEKLYSSFTQIEKKNDLFDLKINNVLVWERVRYWAYQNLKDLLGVGKAHTRDAVTFGTYAKGLSKLFKNTVYKNPLLSDRHNVLFFGHPRRKLLEDGLYWDIYCDPIIDHLDTSCLCVEKPHLMSHKSPPKTDNIRYLDLFQYLFRIVQSTGLYTPKIERDHVKKISGFEEDILSLFDVSIDILPLVQETLLEDRLLGKLYRMLLTQVSPEVVFLVTSYEHEVVIDTCRDLGIITVELQHGVIHEGHAGYAYPKRVKKHSFPDYLLVFGDYWAENVNFPAENDQIVSIGYPYLEMRVDKFKGVEEQDQVLFISQGPIGRKLSQVAVSFKKKVGQGINVVYKLHPGEYDRWKYEYPWLKNSDVCVIDSDSTPLYRLMAESRVQVGVGSTALFEGLAFDLQTLIFDIPGSGPCLPLVEYDQAKLFQTVDELVDLISFSYERKDSANFFKRGSLDRLQRWLSHTVFE